MVTMALMWFVLPQDSSLIQERLHPGAGMKRWDLICFVLSTPLYLLAVVVAGLDVGCFGWTGDLPVPFYRLSKQHVLPAQITMKLARGFSD